MVWKDTTFVWWYINRFLSKWITFILSILCGGSSFTHYLAYVATNQPWYSLNYHKILIYMLETLPLLVIHTIPSIRIIIILSSIWDRVFGHNRRLVEYTYFFQTSWVNHIWVGFHRIVKEDLYVWIYHSQS